MPSSCSGDIGLTELEDLDRVGVVETRGHAGLAEEHVDELRFLDEAAPDSLHHAGLREACRPVLLREIHLGHAAFSEEALQLVPAKSLRVIGRRRHLRFSIRDPRDSP
jgi:hypothetical protein